MTAFTPPLNITQTTGQLGSQAGLQPSREPTTPRQLHAERAMAGDMLNVELDATSSEIREAAGHASDSAKCLDSSNPKDAYGDKKPDLSLIPPPALLAEAKVMQLGARKYGEYNWRKKAVRVRVYTAAAMRHILAWQEGQELDEESGESHLAHARACLGILIDAQIIGNMVDDRYPAVKVQNDTAKTTSNNPGHTDKAGSGY